MNDEMAVLEKADVHEIQSTKVSEDFAVADSGLTQVLSQLNVLVFHPQRVEEYKRKIQSDCISDWRKSRIITTAFYGMFLIPLFELAAIITWNIAFIGICVPISLLMAICAFIDHDYTMQIPKEERVSWRRLPMYMYLHMCESCMYSEFNGQIPESVVSIASLIKDKFPYAMFHVDFLIKGREIPDPFLVVSSYNDEYYIAAWDESGFLK